MTLTPYILPNGTIVDIHEDVARGADTVSFTMKGGAIVDAKRYAGGEKAPIWQVTRFCCTSGMCIDCRAAANGTSRKRIVHADKITRELADRMVSGWKAYDAKVSLMPDRPARGSRGPV